MQQRDAFYTTFNTEVGQKHNEKEAVRYYNWELNPMGLLYRDGKV